MEVDLGSEDAETSPTTVAARLLGVSPTVRKKKGEAGSGSPLSIQAKGSSSSTILKKTGSPLVIPRKVGSVRSTHATPGSPRSPSRAVHEHQPFRIERAIHQLCRIKPAAHMQS
jgi:hypothetical protein